jgi:hypothetical protein
MQCSTRRLWISYFRVYLTSVSHIQSYFLQLVSAETSTELDTENFGLFLGRLAFALISRKERQSLWREHMYI